MRSGSNSQTVEIIPIALIDLHPAGNAKPSMTKMEAAPDPAVVTAIRKEFAGGARYQLVGGEAQLRACRKAGFKEVPVFVLDDNLDAPQNPLPSDHTIRLRYRAVEFLRDVNDMRGRGWDEQRIARRFGITMPQLRSALEKIANGKHDSLGPHSVDQIPEHILKEASGKEPKEMRRVLRRGYEETMTRRKRQIREKQRATLNRLEDTTGSIPIPDASAPVTIRSLRSCRDRAVDMQRVIVAGRAIRGALSEACTTIGTLLADDQFVNLLRAEGLDSIPCVLRLCIEQRKETTETDVPPDQIAGIDFVSVQRWMSRTRGICAEALNLLQGRPLSRQTLWALKKLPNDRQVAVANSMLAMNSFTNKTARALALGSARPSKTEQCVARPETEKLRERTITVERNLLVLRGEFDRARQTYGQDLLVLTATLGYVAKLLGCPQVVKGLERHHSSAMEQFRDLETWVVPT
jgi:ParB family chromosome partitioning protein